MDLLEKFNGAMENTENKRGRVEKAMHSLLVEWKNLRHADSSTQRLLQDSCTAIQSRQERLNTVQESVTISHRELDEITKSLEERMGEVESREKGLRALHEEISEEVGGVKGVLEKGVRDLEERGKFVQGVFDKFCFQRREFERFKGLIEERFEEVKVKEKGIEDRQRELDRGLVELDGKMKNVVEKEEGFEVKERSIKNRQVKLEKFMVDCALKIKNVEEKEKEIEMKEKSVENRKIELDRALIEFDEKMKNLVEREKEVELKVKSVHSNEAELNVVEFDEKMKNLVEKEKEVELKVKSNKNREDELDGLLDEIDLSMKNVREKEKEFQLKEKSIEIREFELDKALVELDMKMKNVEKKEKKIGVKKKSIRKEEIKLEVKKKSIRKREIQLDRGLLEFHVKMRNVMKKEKELGFKEKNFENREKELGIKEKTFESRDIELDGALLEFDLIKKNVEEKEEELEIKEKSIENHRIELESKENEVYLVQVSCEERCRKLELEKEKLELEKKKLEDQMKELEVKNKQFSNVDHLIVKPEPWSDDGSYADIRFSITMDGKNLLLYLINNKTDLDLMADEVYKALRLSMDPAKIVLNAMQDFYMIKEDNEFEEDVVSRSSILLLVQLRRISPQIQSYHKNAAMELARKWKGKMKSSTEVVVFLHLLASYKLESSFEPEEYLSHYEVIDQPTQISELFQLLGYMGKISDLIISLIQKGDRLQAIRYIYEFKLVGKFPPVPILKDHISFNKLLAEEIHGKKTSDEPEGNAIGKQLASLKAVVKCIKDHQLELEYPPESLLARIQQLKEQSKKNTKRADMPKKFGKKRHAAGSDLGPKAQTRWRNRKRRRTEPLVETSLNVPPPAFHSTTNVIS